MIQNIVGDTFGDLVVTRRVASHKKSKSILYECICKLCLQHTEVTSKILLRKRKYKLNCGCTGKSRKRLPGDQAIINKLISGYSSNAKRKKLGWFLSYEMCVELFKTNCFYCNVAPERVFTHKKCRGEFIYNGIDRLDNANGYGPGNVVACCTDCNYMKSNMSYEKFALWIDRVYNFRVGSSYKCNLCQSTLKQVKVNGDDRILSCINCNLKNDSLFELRFDNQGDWSEGWCVILKDGKYIMLSVMNYADHSVTELYECKNGSIYSRYPIGSVKEKLLIPQMTETKIRNLLPFV